MHARSAGSHVIVTGGAGFIGSHLCDALIARQHHVTCVDNLVGTAASTANISHLLEHPNFVQVTEDILEWAERAELRDVACIFHLAVSKNAVCLANPERDLLVNALGTLRLMRAAARDGVRKFVHSSTGSVFGEIGVRHTDDAPRLPVSYYGVSKLAGESYCRVVGDISGLDYSILRYYHVIGPRQADSEVGGVVPIFVRKALSGQPLTIDGDGGQTRSFTSVHDAVRANLIAAEHPQARGRGFNCASGVSVTISELADFVIRETRSHVGVRHGPARVGDIRHFDVDSSGLRELGLEFDTDWQAMVRGVIDFAAQAAA